MSGPSRRLTRYGLASDLLASGQWLPPKAAAAALNCSVEDLIHHYKAGGIRRRNVGPSMWLYEIPGPQ